MNNIDGINVDNLDPEVQKVLNMPVDEESPLSAEDQLYEDMMESWFSEGAGDLLPVEEGGVAEEVEEETHHTRQPRVTSSIGTASVDETDYETGPERYAFEMIKVNIRNSYVKSVKDAARFKAIEWLFIPNHGDMSFDLCCQALGVRPNLIRLRLMYQFQQSWLLFPQPLPFEAQPLPEIFCGEILYDEGDNGLFLAKRIWSFPSVDNERLAEFAKVYKINNWQQILERFDARGLISNKANNWYFTGRNPSAMGIRKRNEFNWARVAV